MLIETFCVSAGAELSRPGSGTSAPGAPLPALDDPALPTGSACRWHAANDNPTTTRATAARLRDTRLFIANLTIDCSYYSQTASRAQTLLPMLGRNATGVRILSAHLALQFAPSR